MSDQNNNNNQNNEQKNNNQKREGGSEPRDRPKKNKQGKKAQIELTSISGTRDFDPEDMRLQRWLFNHFKEVARLFGFQEYDCPILEQQDLYIRKGGEEIVDQMYTFEAKDKDKLALRPEMTPSLARMIMKKGRKLLMPIRWYAIPQCWRFETVQRGRKREHYQWNMDIWGVKDVTAECELLSAIVTFFTRVGITSKDVGIKINSRKILQTVLKNLKVDDDLFPDICIIVDKLDKIGKEQVGALLINKGVSLPIVDEILKTITIKDIDQLESLLPGSEVVQDIKKVWSLAEGYGIQDWIVFDASVVRGLAYYTGIVFECFDRQQKFRAICGGGRYDEILKIYGEKNQIPAVGFGFGDCVIMELLNDKGLLPKLNSLVDAMIIPFNEELRPIACKVANIIRLEGFSVDVQMIPKKKMTWCYEYADRIGVNYVIFVAPDEWSRNEVRIKDLKLPEDDKNKEVNVPLDSLVQFCKTHFVKK